MNREDRDATRFEHEAIILIEYPYGPYDHGKMVNYSQTGMYFEANLPFKSGQNIIFGIENTPYESCPGVYRAIVKWCRRLPDSTAVYYYGIGVEYYRRNRTTPPANIVKSTGKMTGRNGSETRPVLRKVRSKPAGRQRPARILHTDRRITLQPVADFRKYQRKPVAKTVRFTARGGHDEGVVTDISPGGLFLRIPHVYFIGQQLQLAIPISHKKKEIKLLGESVHINQEGLGIKFKSLIRD